MKFTIAIIVILLTITTQRAAAQAYTKGELKARVVNFAEVELEKAGFEVNTTWSAVVLAAKINVGGEDPYLVFKAAVEKKLKSATLFITGGSDSNDTVHIVIVSLDASLANLGPKLQASTPEIFKGVVAAELSIRGTFDGTVSATPREVCLFGQNCLCSGKCKCVGSSATRTCSCYRYFWWYCRCAKCICTSGYFSQNAGKYCNTY